ncbi:histone-lysine N-methyltransferase ATX2-like [Olea europaea subsp. europaea]|uniref:Histone-lysine N-methyltransferase ATX2-like n=1 Tax=Olea europaea subsp. europaea TaxID=158383 RepID=A0A8S0UW86_OLEEU|nr:histone-lysine N-methyltransferase ATX2-like [Olea europaea subsp. europaea]
MRSLLLRCMDKSSEYDGVDANEMVALAASLDDCHGDIIWVKLTGHVGPSNILSESLVGKHKGLNRISRGKSASVQFFGTHDLSRASFFLSPEVQETQFFEHWRKQKCILVNRSFRKECCDC